MKKIILATVILFFTLLSQSLFAQADSLKKVSINGKEFYSYQVKEGEGLYRISKTFNVPQEEIIQYNPQAMSGVSAGMNLNIPVVSSRNGGASTPKIVLESTPQTAQAKTAANPATSTPKTVVKPTPAPVEQPKTVDEPTVKSISIDGEKKSTETAYKIHITEKGETLYGISHLYQVDIETLKKHNPSLADGLQVSEELRIPMQPKTVTTEVIPAKEKSTVVKMDSTGLTYIEHTVQPKETLYSISKLYVTSVDEITKLNPEAAAGIKIDQKLKIPTTQLVAAKPTATRAAQNNAPKATTTAAAVVSAPTTSSAVHENKPVTALKSTDMVVRVALLLPFMTENTDKQDATIDKFIEFYEGFLVGINQLKNEGFSIELNTYDIEKTDAKVRDVIQKHPNLKKMDLIIGPAYSTQLAAVTEFAQANAIPLVVPFSSKVDNISTNQYVFQNNCPQQKQLNKASQLFIKSFGNKNIVVLSFNNDLEDEGSEFARNLKSQLKKQKINFHDIQYTQENFASVQSAMSKGKENILVLATDKTALIKDLLPKIEKMNTANTQISIFGSAKWDNAIKNYHSTYYWTPFYVDKGNKEYTTYRDKFRTEFGSTSTKSPRFDLMGYDIACYFISAVNVYGKNFGYKMDSFSQTHALQSHFDFTKQNQGGYINEGIILIHYSDTTGFDIVE